MTAIEFQAVLYHWKQDQDGEFTVILKVPQNQAPKVAWLIGQQKKVLNVAIADEPMQTNRKDEANGE